MRIRFIILFLYLTSQSYTQGFLTQDLMLSPRFKKVQVVARLTQPYLTDVNRLQLTSIYLKERWQFRMVGSSYIRSSYFSSQIMLGGNHTVADKLRLGISGIHKHRSSEEATVNNWQAGIELLLSFDKWRFLFIAQNVIPGKNNFQDRTELNLRWHSYWQISQDLHISTAFITDIASFPNILLNFYYQNDRRWLFSPFVSIWPVNFGFSIGYNFNGSHSLDIGSWYDVRLGPSPFIRWGYGQ